jgi:hypothetical protein
MRARLTLRRYLGVVVSIFVLLTFSLPAEAAIRDWQKGATIMPHTNTDLASAQVRQSLDDLKATGATYVSFIIPYYQADTNATVINRGGNTPTDETLTTAVQYARSIGLKVSLKMHVETYNHEWRAYINPSDRDAWFNAYGQILLHYGNLGKAQGIEQIVIGTELISMSSDTENATNTANWKKLIASLRAVYNGKLTYGANWGDGGFTEETNQVKFWDDLDSIGVSAYYWLSPTPDDSVESMTATWEDWNQRKIKPLNDTWNKPVLFTEVGYRSITGAHNHPWDWWSDGEFNEQEQANTYTALFSYWNNHDYMNGVYMWSWETDPNAGGAGDKGYTPQNKQAEQVMKEWFSNPPSEPTATAFKVGGENTTASIGVASTETVTVTNTGTTPANVLVNIEIHSPSYEKVHQQFYSTQYFAPGETKTYTTTWTPSMNGTHAVMVGIFNNDWSKNYLWKSDVSSIAVGDEAAPSPTPTPNPDPTPAPTEQQPQSIDIWWPSDSATVSGLQPFKALVSGTDISMYEMYWQVDGGQLNRMDTSTQDYPHKEAMVDLTGWNWKGNASYRITFVAKDANGTVIGSKFVDIYIANNN